MWKRGRWADPGPALAGPIPVAWAGPGLSHPALRTRAAGIKAEARSTGPPSHPWLWAGLSRQGMPVLLVHRVVVGLPRHLHVDIERPANRDTVRQAGRVWWSDNSFSQPVACGLCSYHGLSGLQRRVLLVPPLFTDTRQLTIVKTQLTMDPPVSDEPTTANGSQSSAPAETPAPADSSAPPRQLEPLWTPDGSSPIVDGKYVDLATGEIKTHTGPFRGGPPALSVYWQNRLATGRADQFLVIAKTVSHTVSLNDYIARVGDLLRKGVCKVDSINATRYNIYLVVTTERAQDEFRDALRAHGLL